MDEIVGVINDEVHHELSLPITDLVSDNLLEIDVYVLSSDDALSGDSKLTVHSRTSNELIVHSRREQDSGAIADGLTREMEAMLREIFSVIDKDGDGVVRHAK
eukprot:SAG31_NODE_13647_length_855_cov_1.740741_2_plen_103_part_00